MHAISNLPNHGSVVDNAAKTPANRLAVLRRATARLARLVNAPPTNPRAAARQAVDAMRAQGVK